LRDFIARRFYIQDMSIWILAIALLVIFAALGLVNGAIRMTISLFGVVIGAVLAVPLAGLMRPLFTAMGMKNPAYLAIIPPAVVFLLIYLIVFGLSFFAHHKIYLIYKYKRDDVDRIRWERMNRMVGATVGVLTGVIFFFLLSGIIYAGGYLTTQLSGEENSPGYIKFINGVREDMSQTGFDKAAAKFDPAPKIFYQAADVFGLLYHNPLLQNRLSTYPYYLSLAQRPEFQEIATDKEYNDMIFGKAPVTQIIAHPRTQAMLGNQEVINYLKGTDVNDLKTYLKTGKSPKYDPIEILGVWDLDKNAILTQMRKANPDIKARELRQLKQQFDAVPSVVMIATPDQKVIFNAGGGAAAAPAPDPNAAPVEPTAPENDPNARYRNLQQAVQPAPKPAAAPVEAAAPPIPQLSGEGAWKEEAGQYLITAPNPSGKEQTVAATVQGDEMILHTPIISLVFTKQ
jgi:uncharacterized membrane protein required for colicin V production